MPKLPVSFIRDEAERGSRRSLTRWIKGERISFRTIEQKEKSGHLIRSMSMPQWILPCTNHLERLGFGELCINGRALIF